MKRTLLFFGMAIQSIAGAARERVNFDAGWRFALGHAHDADKDFGHDKGYFSYLAKAGYGDGPADAKFDDRPWRLIDLPHDWCVELPFNQAGGHSHGYRAIGRKFPENSVGWYRKTFELPKADDGRRVSIELDGVHRDAKVWINGFYMGREQSGYVGVSYDFTDVANFGGKNTISVRADATTEEGWFYEGAGIYRHTWLVKTAPVHFSQNGIFVDARLEGAKARLAIEARVANEGGSGTLNLEHEVLGPDGNVVTALSKEEDVPDQGGYRDFKSNAEITTPVLWSLESPKLYTLRSRIKAGEVVVDEVKTRFGVREIKMDPGQGLFINGKHVKVKGVNQHQDHAGVGTAIPDALQEWRVLQLKAMGANAIRCSHNPPTPELLEICDRLGVLVMDENRLMGTAAVQMASLEWLVRRDRNHPSVFMWSLGNEEWAIEGGERGAKLAAPAQALVKRLDGSRPVTAAMSGGWGRGTDRATEVIGLNYIDHGNPDEHHKNFPTQPMIGSEESTTMSTRGVYASDKSRAHRAPSDREAKGSNIETGWKYFMERPFLAGLFWWTGFDYKGEPNPDGWPQVSTQFGILDSCGFPKDPWQYLRAWWREGDPYVGIAPHWNWEGSEGKEVQVWVRANTEEVELIHNGKSLGTKKVEKLGHLEWTVPYAPGRLLARGISGGKEVAGAKVETAGPAAAILAEADRALLRADGTDVAVLSLSLVDAKGNPSVLAGDELSFRLEGPGKLIGLGNGDPASREPDLFIDEVKSLPITGLKALAFNAAKAGAEVGADFDASAWKEFFYLREEQPWGEAQVAVRGSFELDETSQYSEVILLPKAVLDVQDVYVNGKLLHSGQTRKSVGPALTLKARDLRKGVNSWAVFGKPMAHRDQWDDRNTDAGVVRTVKPAKAWKRKAFNGLAQVLVQAGGQAGTITFHAEGPGLKPAVLKLKTEAFKK